MKFADLIYGNIFKIIVSYGVDDNYLIFNRNGRISVLLEDFHNTLTQSKALLSVLIKVGTELGECLKLSVLRVCELQ